MEDDISNLFDRLDNLLSFGTVLVDESPKNISELNTDQPEKFEALAKAFFELQFEKKNLDVIGVKKPGVGPAEIASIESRVADFCEIYIVRRPSDVIASSLTRMMNTSVGLDEWHIASLEHAIVEWAVNWEYIVESARKPGALVVSYGQFQRDGPAEIERIAQHVSVDPHLFHYPFWTTERLYALSEAEQDLIARILGDHERQFDIDVVECMKTMPMVLLPIASGQKVLTRDDTPLSRLLLKSGFSDLESWGVWSEQPEALVCFRLDSRNEGPCFVEIEFSTFMGDRSTFDLIISTDGHADYRFNRVDTNAGSVYVRCTPDEQGVVTLRLRFPQTKSPTEEPIADRRALGIGLMSIGVL